MAKNNSEFKFTVTAKVKHVEGEGDRPDQEEIAEEIRIYLEDDTNPGEVYLMDHEYEITEWTVVTS